MITYSKQTIDNNDILQVSKVLKSDFLTQGPKVPIFEKNLVNSHLQNIVLLLTARLQVCI